MKRFKYIKCEEFKIKVLNAADKSELGSNGQEGSYQGAGTPKVILATSSGDHHMDQQVVCYLLLQGQKCTACEPPQGQGAKCLPPSSMDTEPDAHQEVHSSWCRKRQNSILYTGHHNLM